MVGGMAQDRHHPPSPTRRLALWTGLAALWGALVAAAGLGLGAVLRLAGGGRAGAAAAGPVDLGRREPAVGQVRVKEGVALVRDGRGLYALSLVCPHLGCRPRWHPGEHRFLCPCHGSAFDAAGARLKGPARRGLKHLALERRGGRLLAWPGREVPPHRRLAPTGEGA